jgi:predicted lactoylglutathione lyase
LTKLHQFNEKVRQGIANYLRSKRGGQSGKKRAMAYQRMFKTQTRDPEGNLTVAEVLFNSIISLALLGEQHGQNMRAFVVESLAEGIGGQLEQKALLEKMLHTYLFNDEANKVLLFNAEFSANCYELRQYANAKPSTGLREITAAISQTLDKYTSALEARVVENSGDNSDETTDSEKDLQSSKKGFRQPYFS